MVANDYRYDAACPGCVAIVDDYPPTPTQVCQTNDNRLSGETFTTSKLTSYIGEETKFTYFYSSTNVKNNGPTTTAGDNVRVDVEAMEMKDFFQTSVTPSTSVGSSCFTNNFIKNLLDSASSASLPSLSSIVQGVDHSSLECKRCCFKSIVLKERFAQYECGVTSPTWSTQGSSHCEFGGCLTVPPTTLLEGHSQTTTDCNTKTQTTLNGLAPGTNPEIGDYVIHRSITCTSFDTSPRCTFQPKLKDLISKSANWNAAAGVPSGYSADNYVFWRYKPAATGSFVAWNDDDVLTFQDPTTLVTVQAWSRCGMVYEQVYKVKLHPHSTRDVCNNFLQRWVDNSPNPRKVDNNICAYPGSDFALLTFNYDSLDNVNHVVDTVKGKYTDVTCTLTVAEEGGIDTTASTPLTLSWPPLTNSRIQIAKQFALELIKDPKTAKNTDVKVVCTFKFEYYDDPKVDMDSCPATFRLTDCDRPTVETYSSDVVCLPGACGAPNGLPGAFETCDGSVYTTVTSGSTVSTASKSVNGGCCAGCNSRLTCTTLPGTTSGIKRCEPPAAAAMLMALAMDDSEKAVANYAQSSVSSMATTLMGVSAMVAVVALVAVRRRRATAQAKAVSNDEAYYALMG